MQALMLLAEEGGSNLSWLLWVVLIVFLLIVLIGWWVSRNKGEQAEVQPEAPAVQKTADDLTILEGVGPKVAQILTEAGYASFADLAKADHVEVDKILDANKLQMLDSAGWIDQAKLAAAGDMEGLTKLQDELKGGRKAS
jgi:large subunit ribosomal protein L21